MTIGLALALVGLCIISFLLGSIPWGMLISKCVFHIDIRKHGSGNIGSTNVFRILGAKGGIACFVLDFAKGLVAILLACALYADLCAGGIVCTLIGGPDSLQGILDGPIVRLTTVELLAFLFNVWGHVFSPWLGFKGGKGVATGVGCMFGVLGWQYGCILLVVFIVVVVITRYVSLGSLCGSAMGVVLSIFRFPGDIAAVVMVAIGVATIFWAHRSNIKRLIEGTESKFSVKKNK